MKNIIDILFALEKVTIEINGKDINRYLICIISKQTKLELYTTDYTKYIYYSDGRTKNIKNESYKDVLYVVDMLNWILIQKNDYYGVTRIEDVTFQMCQDYLNHYAIFGANDRGGSPAKESIKTVRGYISRFLYGLKKEGINNDINNHWIRKSSNKSSRRDNSYIYELDVVHDGADFPEIFRDIPTEAVVLILTCVRVHMPLMELPIALQCYSGIREGEICNCRRIDSIYGAGIVFEMERGNIKGVTIVLKKEYRMRTDRKTVGHIKSKQDARIYPAFLESFLDVYNRHLQITAAFKVDETKPLFVNERINRTTGYHMAMSVYSYKSNFHKLMKQYVLPIMRKSDNPWLRDFAQVLDQNRYGLHWFRHWFSVQLVLAGECWQTLMDYRRDRSPESAITYIRNKKVFMEMYSKANASFAKDIITYDISNNDLTNKIKEDNEEEDDKKV